MNDEKLDKIIELLTTLVSANQGPGVDDRPWTSRLIEEYSVGEDMDGNGLIFGHDFIFNHELSWYPPALKTVAENLKTSFKGKSITMLEYVEGLPLEDPKRDAIYDYLSKKQQLNG